MEKNAETTQHVSLEEKKCLVKTKVDILQTKILRHAIAAVIAVGGLLSLLTLTLLYIDRYQLQVEALMRQTHNTVFTIEVWLEKVRAIAGQVSARTAVRNNLIQYIEGQKTLEAYQKEAQDKLIDLLTPALIREDIFSLLQFNLEGDLLFNIGMPVSHRHWLPLLQKKDLHISDPFFMEGHKVIAVKSDIYDRTLKKVGFNVLILPTKAIETRLNQIQKELDHDHLMISLVYWSATDDESTPRWKSLYHTTIANASHSWNFEQAAAELTQLYPDHLPSQLRLVMKNDYAEKFLVRTKNIPNTSWAILLYSEEKNFYHPIIKYLIVAFFVFLIAILLSSLWLKKNISPLSAAVVQSAFEQSEKIREQSYFVARKNQSLQETLEKLKKTQNQLIESETFASVGRMVAGVSHEINTPLGVAISAMSHLNYEIDLFGVEFNQGPIRRTSLEKVLGLAKEYGIIIVQNLQQAAGLVRSLKQVSVDQMDSDFREVYLKDYLQTILTSLTPLMKSKEISLYIVGDKTFKLETFPGIITQVITNLVENSVKHGFKTQTQGEIHIEFFQREKVLHVIYSDNGSGIEPELLPKVFDAFFTTGRAQGCTGLGLHIVKSIVMQKLNGQVQVKAQERGVAFEIVWPLEPSRFKSYDVENATPQDTRRLGSPKAVEISESIKLT